MLKFSIEIWQREFANTSTFTSIPLYIKIWSKSKAESDSLLVARFGTETWGLPSAPCDSIQSEANKQNKAGEKDKKTGTCLLIFAWQWWFPNCSSRQCLTDEPTAALCTLKQLFIKNQPCHVSCQAEAKRQQQSGRIKLETIDKVLHDSLFSSFSGRIEFGSLLYIVPPLHTTNQTSNFSPKSVDSLFTTPQPCMHVCLRSQLWIYMEMFARLHNLQKHQNVF